MAAAVVNEEEGLVELSTTTRRVKTLILATTTRRVRILMLAAGCC